MPVARFFMRKPRPDGPHEGVPPEEQSETLHVEITHESGGGVAPDKTVREATDADRVQYHRAYAAFLDPPVEEIAEDVAAAKAKIEQLAKANHDLIVAVDEAKAAKTSAESERDLMAEKLSQAEKDRDMAVDKAKSLNTEEVDALKADLAEARGAADTLAGEKAALEEDLAEARKARELAEQAAREGVAEAKDLADDTDFSEPTDTEEEPAPAPTE